MSCDCCGDCDMSGSLCPLGLSTGTVFCADVRTRILVDGYSVLCYEFARTVTLHYVGDCCWEATWTYSSDDKIEDIGNGCGPYDIGDTTVCDSTFKMRICYSPVQQQISGGIIVSVDDVEPNTATLGGHIETCDPFLWVAEGGMIFLDTHCLDANQMDFWVDAMGVC